jgi:quercetin dioxygenase-like cupin family protein
MGHTLRSALTGRAALGGCSGAHKSSAEESNIRTLEQGMLTRDFGHCGGTAVKNVPFADMITRMPEADIPFAGVRGWISQGADHQVVFLDIAPIGLVTPHRHGAQWGIVVEGEMELTVGGVTQIYGPGDSYHIPGGVEHAARFLSRVRVIDVFEGQNRYRPKGAVR